MIGAIAIVVAYLAIGWAEGIPLYRQGHRREATIFTIVWVIGLAYSLPAALDVSVPNPAYLLKYIYGPFLPLS